MSEPMCPRCREMVLTNYGSVHRRKDRLWSAKYNPEPSDLTLKVESYESRIAELEAQLEAEREKLREKPSLTRVSGVGQIRAGSPLLLETREGDFVLAKAKLVLFPGDPDEEEVVYRKRMNHYFITGMVLNGTSHIRNVWIVQATSPEPVAWEYYYKTKGCSAKNAHDPDCICWHKEGTGPYDNERHDSTSSPVIWRLLTSPHQQQVVEP